jgi:hypothetical protein
MARASEPGFEFVSEIGDEAETRLHGVLLQPEIEKRRTRVILRLGIRREGSSGKGMGLKI